MAAGSMAARKPPAERLAGWLPLAVFPCGALVVRDFLPDWLFMWVLALAIFGGLKWLSWWQARGRVEHAGWRSLAYLVAWPGMDAGAFLDEGARPPRPAGREWTAAAVKTALGVVLLWRIARVAQANALLCGWIGMTGLILLLHFGSFHLVALAWQNLGVDAQAIMSSPLRSTSLSEFWGQRWNLGFRQLSHDLVFRPLHRRIGTWPATWLVFALSGLLHDLVISMPARGGYGLPTLYFVLQGLGLAMERSSNGRRLGLGSGLRGRLFMAVCTAGPVYWLFHPAFVLRVILPFMKGVHAL